MLNKRLNFKGFKLLMWLIFLIYLAILVEVVILKNGTAITIARSRAALGLEMPLSKRIAYSNFIPFKTILLYISGQGYNSIQNIFGNILVFIPLGFLLPILFNNCKRLNNTIFISILVSASIETIQLLFNLGSCDIDDLILNTLGSIIGFVIYNNINFSIANKLKLEIKTKNK